MNKSNTMEPKGGNCDLNQQYSTWGPQGWICPRCGRVLSPYMNTCPFCSEYSQFNYTTTSSPVIGDPTISISCNKPHIKTPSINAQMEEIK